VYSRDTGRGNRREGGGGGQDVAGSTRGSGPQGSSGRSALAQGPRSDANGPKSASRASRGGAQRAPRGEPKGEMTARPGSRLPFWLEPFWLEPFWLEPFWRDAGEAKVRAGERCGVCAGVCAGVSAPPERSPEARSFGAILVGAILFVGVSCGEVVSARGPPRFARGRRRRRLLRAACRSRLFVRSSGTLLRGRG
jgi:hypothetical protein